MSVSFEFDREFLLNLLNSTNLSKSELVDSLDLHRTNFKRLIEGEKFLTFGQIENVLNLSNFNWKNIISRTKILRIGRISKLEPQERFIKFLIENR